ncbi:MAG TPA: hypothetical protein VI197_28065 [Polyangiaceae bacterium]
MLQLGGANLGDVLDVACARFSRWAGGPTAAQLSKTLRERWAASSPVVGAGVAVPPPAARRRSGGGDAGDAHRAAAGADPRRGAGVDGRGAAVARARPRPARPHRARGAARGLDAALAGVSRPVVAIERVAELEQIR